MRARQQPPRHGLAEEEPSAEKAHKAMQGGRGRLCALALLLVAALGLLRLLRVNPIAVSAALRGWRGRSGFASLPPAFCPSVSPGRSLFKRVWPPTGAAPLPPVNCTWATISYPVETGWPAARDNLRTCIHDPSVDQSISRSIATKKRWLDHSNIRALADMGPCSEARPIFLDVGANIGTYAIAAAVLGCHVVAIEAMSANAVRIIETFRAAGLLDSLTLYHNAVGLRPGTEMYFRFDVGNPGVSAVVNNQAAARELAEGSAAPGEAKLLERVSIVTIDDLFLPIGDLDPLAVSFVKIDVEGTDAIALSGASRLFSTPGSVPFASIEMNLFDLRQSKCDAAGLWDWLHASFGAAYVFRAFTVVPPSQVATGAAGLRGDAPRVAAGLAPLYEYPLSLSDLWMVRGWVRDEGSGITWPASLEKW